MNLLITNIELTVPGGTVTYVLDLCEGLKKRGFTIEVFTHYIGEIGEDIRNSGINVVTNLDELLYTPDIIHAHHYLTVLEILQKFPDTPVVYLIHNRRSPHDYAIRHEQILKYVAVDYNCYERILNAGIPPEYTTVIHNWVNTEKFKLRKDFQPKPRAALVFSNYASQQNYYKAIVTACDAARLQLDVIGKSMGNSIRNPEDHLQKYDLVFAKAKAAIEALATGAAVILCDSSGLGEMVTSRKLEYFRDFNFGGKLLTRPAKPNLILEEIMKFDREENELNAGRIRTLSSFDISCDKLVELYTSTVLAYSRGQKGPARKTATRKMIDAFITRYCFNEKKTFYKIITRARLLVKKMRESIWHATDAKYKKHSAFINENSRGNT